MPAHFVIICGMCLIIGPHKDLKQAVNPFNPAEKYKFLCKQCRSISESILFAILFSIDFFFLFNLYSNPYLP